MHDRGVSCAYFDCRHPLVFFKTYVGAAVDAVQLGFMGEEGLESVIKAATEKLESVPRSSDKWRDIEFDIERAKLMLEARGN